MDSLPAADRWQTLNFTKLQKKIMQIVRKHVKLSNVMDFFRGHFEKSSVPQQIEVSCYISSLATFLKIFDDS